MAQDMVRIVPQELSDSVIDYLHDDLPSLRQCSLVCKSWVRTSTEHLFSIIAWPPSHPTIPGREGLPDAVSFAEFHELLKSSPRLCGALRHLKLFGARGWEGPGIIFVSFFGAKPDVQSLPIEFLHALPKLLPRLHTLELWNLNITFEPGTIPSSLQPPPSISSLSRLSFVTTMGMPALDYDSIIIAISTFSHIQDLVLDCIVQYAAALPGTEPLPSPRRFESTAVANFDASNLRDGNPSVLNKFDVVVKQLDLSALRQVAPCSPPESVPANGPLLTASPALEALAYTPESYIPLLHLQNPGNLQILDLSFGIVPSAHDPVEFMSSTNQDHVMRHLAKVPKLSSLRKLIVTIMISDLFRDHANDPDQFAQRFSEFLQRTLTWEFKIFVELRRLPRLQELKFVVAHRPMRTDLSAYLAPCGRALEEVAAEKLTLETKTSIKVTVVAECRPVGGEAVCHFQALITPD
ncbi:hypothetical protein PsYK624_129800 [Phanerochaete sordida]|uniref:F-box domain-containing protein n=1 Tax=Phanerochaete sordida TaxID=48140 RepID=A0A9P3LJK8_9APHY|nr:hypothetical protein PsYK624_129800 [Phanerochaete sordida]